MNTARLTADHIVANRISISSIGYIEIRDARGTLITTFPTRSTRTCFTEHDKQNLLNLLTQEECNY